MSSKELILISVFTFPKANGDHDILMSQSFGTEENKLEMMGGAVSDMQSDERYVNRPFHVLFAPVDDDILDACYSDRRKREQEEFNPDMTNDLGESIRIFRKVYKLTQQEMGEITGVSRSLISNIERGQGNYTINTFLKITSRMVEYEQDAGR